MSCAFKVSGLENQLVKFFSNLCCDAIIYSCVCVCVCVCSGRTVCEVPSAAVYHSELPLSVPWFPRHKLPLRPCSTIEQFYHLP